MLISGLVDIDVDSIMFLSFGRFVVSISGLGSGKRTFTMSLKTTKRNTVFIVTTITISGKNIQSILKISHIDIYLHIWQLSTCSKHFCRCVENF